MPPRPPIRRAPPRRIAGARGASKHPGTRASRGTSRAAAPTAYHHGDLPNALVAAALDLIREAGLEGLTLRAVARRAGVSEAAPYRHFADKDALLAAVAEQGFLALGRKMDAEASREPGADVLTRLRRLGAAYVRYAVENPAHFRVMMGPVVARRKDYPSLDRVANASFGRLLAVLAEAQQVGIVAEGQLQDIGLAAWSFVHGLAALAIEGHLDEWLSRESVAALMPRIAQYLFLGLGPRG